MGEFPAAAKRLHDSGDYVSKNALEILLTRGDPEDQGGFDREARQEVFMGTSVQDAAHPVASLHSCPGMLGKSRYRFHSKGERWISRRC